MVIATPWSPPVRMKSNSSLIGGSLNTSSYADYAAYLNDFVNYMSVNNASLYAVSVQNEPDIQVTYESCNWTASQISDFLKNNGAAITGTNVIAPESYIFDHAMSDPVLNDAGAAANVDIIGGHIYGGGLADYPLARSKGKEVWMTEHLVTDTTWNAVFATAKEIHDCLTVGNFNAYIWWYAKRFYGPLGETDIVTKRGYIMAHYARFIRPGYHRVDATANPLANVYVSAYTGVKNVIVVMNQNKYDETINFTFKNTAVTSVTPYVTSQTSNLKPGDAIAVDNGTFTYAVPAQSLTTIVQN